MRTQTPTGWGLYDLETRSFTEFQVFDALVRQEKPYV